MQLTLAVHTVAGGTPKGVKKLIHALHSRHQVRVVEHVRRRSRSSAGAVPGRLSSDSKHDRIALATARS